MVREVRVGVFRVVHRWRAPRRYEARHQAPASIPNG